VLMKQGDKSRKKEKDAKCWLLGLETSKWWYMPSCEHKRKQWTRVQMSHKVSVWMVVLGEVESYGGVGSCRYRICSKER
jgi:hypothetical protein